MAMIELGEANERSPVAGGPGWNWRATRRLWPFGLALLALLTLTAAAPARRAPEATIRINIGATSIVQGGEAIFVIDPLGTAGVPNPHVVAFRLPGAEPLWRVPVPIAATPAGQAVAGGVPVGAYVADGAPLLLSANPETGDVPRTVALDTATGRTRWDRPGGFASFTIEGAALLWDAPPTIRDAATEAVEPAGTLRAVDPATGAERWAYPVPARTQLSYHPDGRNHPDGTDRVDLVVLWTRDEPVRLLDATTGRIAGTLAPPVEPPRNIAARVGESTGYWSGVQVVGDLLMLLGPDQTTLTAYGLARLDRRWTVQRDPKTEFWLDSCGAYPCFRRPQGGVRVLDPATGRTLWTDGSPRFLWPVGDYLLAGDMIFERAAPMTALETRTGRVVGELGTWALLDQPDQRGPRLVLRQKPSGKAWLAELDPSTATSRVLMELSDISGGCVVYRTVFTCRRLDGSTALWPIPE
ncbi:PQQ-binding-like beta-propeller repeat protein [Micromonospora sp. NPDC049559]|uniref:outer membrane protein assembly factor BamB family protein n=1 Tax=Micromonospora sp. NPDC049559 TaxID=3155923 RepID=UPI00343C4A8C